MTRDELARVRYGTHTGRAPRARRMPFALLVVTMIVGGLVVLLALNTVAAANELRANELNTRDDAVGNDVQQLRIDVADDAAPDHLAAAAEQLGMVPADAPAFIVLGPHGRTLLRGHPKAASGGNLPVPLAPSYKQKVAAATSSSSPTATSPTSARKSPAAKKSTSAGKSTSAKKSTSAGKSTSPRKAAHHRPTPRRHPATAATTGGHR